MACVRRRHWHGRAVCRVMAGGVDDAAPYALNDGLMLELCVDRQRRCLSLCFFGSCATRKLIPNK